MKNALISAITLFTGILMAGNTGFALPITGSVDFSGGAALDGTTLDNATQVLSWSSVSVTPLGVTPGSVLDAFINPGDSVAMVGPWDFTAGRSNLWSIHGFTFDLETSGIIAQTADFLSVKGFGMLSGNGYDPTPGTWFFSSQGAGIGSANFAFAASTRSGPVSVPDQGITLVLLGATLCVLVLTQRRFSAHMS